MGNQQNGHRFGRKPYNFCISLVDLKTKVNTEGIKFEPSPYNIQEDKFSVTPVMDKNVRNSEFTYLAMPQLSEQSQTLIKQYLSDLTNFTNEYDQVNTNWRMTRYNQQGHFLEHCDRQKFMQGHRHFGTEIFLPPYSETRYEGGELKVTYEGQVTQILPHDSLWTHIIIPLGIEHQVRKVRNGVRISYVKEIWVIEEEEEIQTDQQREIRERSRNNRRHMEFVD